MYIKFNFYKFLVKKIKKTNHKHNDCSAGGSDNYCRKKNKRKNIDQNKQVIA